MKKSEIEAAVRQEFNRGYACAVSCIVAGHGGDTATREALEANGMTSIKKLEEMGIEKYDIDVLRPLVEEIEDKERRKRLW